MRGESKVVVGYHLGKFAFREPDRHVIDQAGSQTGLGKAIDNNPQVTMMRANQILQPNRLDSN